MDKIKDLGLEFGEIIVDNREFSEAIKDFPILRTISAANDIRNAIFISKLKSFLKPLKDIPKEKIKNEISKIDTSEKYRKKIGHNLINLIDRSFEEENSENIAILFRAFLNEEISYDQFKRTARILTDIDSSVIEGFYGWVNSNDGDGSRYAFYDLSYFEDDEVPSSTRRYDGENWVGNTYSKLNWSTTEEGEIILKVFGGN